MWEFIREVLMYISAVACVTVIFVTILDSLKSGYVVADWTTGLFLLFGLAILSGMLLAPSKEEDMIRKNDVVQFTEDHKWCGCLGVVTEVKDCGDYGYRYQIGVPIPRNDKSTGTAFIFDNGSGIERVGEAVLTLPGEEA